MVTVSFTGNFTITCLDCWHIGHQLQSQEAGDHLANWGGFLPLREEDHMIVLELVATRGRRLVEHHSVHLGQDLFGHDARALLPQLLVVQDKATSASKWEVTSKVVFKDLALLALKSPQFKDKFEAVCSAALVLVQAGGLVQGGEEGKELLGELVGGEGGGKVARRRGLAETLRR